MNKYEVYLGDLTCEKIKYSDETIKYGVKTNVIFLNNYELKEIQESMMKTLYWYLIDKSDLEHLEQELQRKDNIINGIEEYIRNYYDLLVKSPDIIEEGQLDILYEVLDKIKELENDIK